MAALAILAASDDWPPSLVAHLLRRVRKGGRLKRMWRRAQARKGAKS